MDAAASGARSCSQGGFSRERTRRAGRTALKRTAKPCGPDTRGWCQAAGGEIDPTGSIRHQAGSDGGKTNSSPGRARHKPSNHCAGNAGVLRLYLYARVRTSLCTLHTRPRVQQAPGIPCSLCLRERNFSKARAQRAARTRTCIRMTAERGTFVARMERSEIRGSLDAVRESRIALRSIRATWPGCLTIELRGVRPLPLRRHRNPGAVSAAH
ncbi:hypothetical protein V1279_002325 [Bradyrhizobium sp. AZCC 1610]